MVNKFLNSKVAIVASVIGLTIGSTQMSFAQDVKWRNVSPQNMVIMTLPHGDVVFELSTDFSPEHVKQFKKLTRDGLYKDNKFYRVIDGFVAQGGPDEATEKKFEINTLKIEEDLTIDKNWYYTKVQDNDLFAPITGFKNGFGIGVDEQAGKAWLTHCPGILALGRGNEPDTATSHFYITNGQAPRYLDRIMSVFGRVIYGMNHVQAIQRTAVIEGDDQVPSEMYTPILDMQLMSDLPEEKQWQIAVEDTNSEAFVKKLDDRRKRDNAFFYKKPPPVLDVCQVPVATKLIYRPK
ncbi:peptidylprolyl isomerase [Thalassotalea sp. LPB0316]|uniref:peptidylprolyl isomerase n=1 Tax=Thalassotalea sp. LPB0316 TaxID=2769490 RepID=UPI001866FA19|nr:peptidylprolyl isomerase [Thalassotalea sp. LPB0316]QOL26249.1 peptidylprolyl isomerase [Thalassotalea sp. LPB0316]